MWETKGRKPELPALVYGRFPPYPMARPINWCDNPFDNRQWQHNFMTLRWIPSTRPAVADPEALRQSLAILDDYLAWHLDASTKKSPYYNTRLGDLAAGIRMPILTEFYLFLSDHPDQDSYGVRERLFRQMRAELDLMLSEAFYEKRSNHLVGLDIGALHALILVPELEPTGKEVSFCEARLEKMLASIFDSAGVVKEHSVHYQAYNAWMCIQLLELFERSGHISSLQKRVRQIMHTTRRVLPFGIKPNGEYHLIGDTFQRPLVRYLKNFTTCCRKLFPDEVPEDETRVDQQDTTRHAMIAAEAGFASIRFQWGPNARNRTFHLYQTSGWHSNIHKQGDEISFSLYSGGGDLLVDPGYTDLEDSVEADHESPWRHNTIVSPNILWQHRSMATPTGGGMTGYHIAPGLVAVRSELRRIPGVLVTRVLVFIQPGFLCVLDHIKSDAPNPFEQRFTFAPGADVIPVGEGCFDIERNGMPRMQWTSQGPGFPNHSFFDNYLVQDKGFRSEGVKMLPTRGISFHAEGQDMRLHHLLAPASGRMQWDKGSFHANVRDNGQVTIRFRWNMVRIEHDFRLQPFGKDEALIIRKI